MSVNGRGRACRSWSAIAPRCVARCRTSSRTPPATPPPAAGSVSPRRRGGDGRRPRRAHHRARSRPGHPAPAEEGRIFRAFYRGPAGPGRRRVRQRARPQPRAAHRGCARGVGGSRERRRARGRAFTLVLPAARRACSADRVSGRGAPCASGSCSLKTSRVSGSRSPAASSAKAISSSRPRTARRGCAAASSEPFDLVVLDVMLPDRSGFDVCRDLRQRGVADADPHAHRARPGRGPRAGPEARAPTTTWSSPSRCPSSWPGSRRGCAASRPPRREARRELPLRRGRRGLPEGGGHAGGDAGRGLGQGVPAPPLSHQAARRHPLPRRAAQRGLGLRRDADHAHRRRARGLAAPQDRAQPAQPQYILTVHGLGYKFVG